MERIKQALEKARQERQAQQKAAPAAPPASQEVGDISYDQTQSVTMNEAVLRRNRIIAGMATSPFTESYNLLRTQILQRFRENNWNVLAVTSPGPGAGKTLTAINLAISMAREVDHTVMLVDANLRHPQMLEHLGIPQRKGLSDYLKGDAQISELLVRPSGIEHLVILPAGQPLVNSSEMLSSPKMVQLVEETKSRYQGRIIIFSLPSVLSSADAMAFAPYVDAALLVVEEGVSQKEDVERAVDLLSSTNIIGTVLNKAELKSA